MSAVPKDPTSGLLTKADVAELLKISTRQVQRFIADRKLSAIRLGHKTLRIRQADLERFMKRETY